MSGNSKGALQEYCQSHGLPLPIYFGLKRSGVDHSPRFKIKVQVGNKCFSSDEGCLTRKKAEKSAAQYALEALMSQARTHYSSSTKKQHHSDPQWMNLTEVLSEVTQFASRGKMERFAFSASQGRYQLEIEGNYHGSAMPMYRKVKIVPADTIESNVQTVMFPRVDEQREQNPGYELRRRERSRPF